LGTTSAEPILKGWGGNAQEKIDFQKTPEKEKKFQKRQFLKRKREGVGRRGEAIGSNLEGVPALIASELRLLVPGATKRGKKGKPYRTKGEGAGWPEGENNSWQR